MADETTEKPRKCKSGDCPHERVDTDGDGKPDQLPALAGPKQQGPQLSPVGYAVGGAIAGYIVSAFFGVQPIIGAALGGGAGYFYGRTR